MMDALLLNRVEFVKLLLENGVSLKRFLTINRLEQLYNAEPIRLSILYHLLGPRYKANANKKLFTLPDIGETVEKLMGNAFRSHYTTRGFKNKYEKYKKRATVSLDPHLIIVFLAFENRELPFEQRRRSILRTFLPYNCKLVFRSESL